MNRQMRTKTLLAVVLVVLLAGSVAMGPGVAPGETHEPSCVKQSETRGNDETE